MFLQNNNGPHAKRDINLIKPDTLKRGWLKNGNVPGDFSSAPRCNAHAKQTKQPCRQPAMANGKCRLHGGLSTGPKTPQGVEKARKANWKHGEYSAESMANKKELNSLLKQVMQGLKDIKSHS